MKKFSIRIQNTDLNKSRSRSRSRSRSKVSSINIPRTLCCLYCLLKGAEADTADDVIKAAVHDLKCQYEDTHLGGFLIKDLSAFIHKGLIKEILDKDDILIYNAIEAVI